MALISLALLASLVRSGDSVVLHWTPKVGDKAAYKLEATLNSTEAPFPLHLTGTITQETRSVETVKVVTRVTGTLNAEFNASSRSIDYPLFEATARPDGAVQAVDDGSGDPEAGGYRQARLEEIVFPAKPVAVGDTWVYEEPKAAKVHLPGLHIDYTFVGGERVGAWDTWIVASKARETGDSKATTEATIWIEKGTGRLIHLHKKMTDVPSPAPQGALDSGEWDYVRQS